jgi:hypothetical protein
LHETILLPITSVNSRHLDLLLHQEGTKAVKKPDKASERRKRKQVSVCRNNSTPTRDKCFCVPRTWHTLIGPETTSKSGIQKGLFVTRQTQQEYTGGAWKELERTWRTFEQMPCYGDLSSINASIYNL